METDRSNGDGGLARAPPHARTRGMATAAQLEHGDGDDGIRTRSRRQKRDTGLTERHFFFCDGCKAKGLPENTITGQRWRKHGTDSEYDLCQACFETDLTAAEQRQYHAFGPSCDDGGDDGGIVTESAPLLALVSNSSFSSSDSVSDSNMHGGGDGNSTPSRRSPGGPRETDDAREQIRQAKGGRMRHMLKRAKASAIKRANGGGSSPSSSSTPPPPPP